MKLQHLSYGLLQPITSPPRSFHTITIDLILVLPTSTKGYDLAMLITNKYNKQATFISEKITWGANEWAIEFLNQLIKWTGASEEQFSRTEPNGLWQVYGRQSTRS